MSKPRPHLVERAIEALGGTDAVIRPDQTAAAARDGFSDGTAATVEAPALPPSASSPVPDELPPDELSPPIIGRDALKRAGLLIGEAGRLRSRLSEEVSILQQQLLRRMKAAEPAEGRCSRTILVTSARPGEGKTFTAINIAASIAANGTMPVLLVDTDGKRGSATELLGTDQAPGLRLLAAGQASRPASLVLATAQPRLSFLPYGTPVADQPAAPPDAMLVAAILHLASTMPDHVLVLDSPPCLSTSDPSNLAPIVGQVLMVVQAENTRRDEVEAALDMVESCPNLQLVLNRMRLTGTDTFGAYGAYATHGSDEPHATGG